MEQVVTRGEAVAPTTSQPTALYRLYGDGGVLLYVGITMDMAWRWKRHARHKPWWQQVVGATIEHHDSRAAALDAEREAIETEKPTWNIQHQVRPPVRKPRRSTVDHDDGVLRRLGDQRRAIVAEIKDIKPELHAAMRAARAANLTYREIMELSGYQTIQQVRVICGATGKDDEE